MREDKILIVGANGQIGSVLTQALCDRYSKQQVVASDIKAPSADFHQFELLNILDRNALDHLIQKHQITQVYHLAAILSAKGEQNPQQAWALNMNGLFNVLEAAKDHNLDKIFFPSSIAVFGPQTPKDNTKQWDVLSPTTVYGISKQAGESWCQYYFQNYDVDVRSIRYPGIIGHQTLAGGGTTDYAVDIFHAAAKREAFSCFLTGDSYLPMIYMPDAINAVIQLMDAPKENIKVRTSYNLSSMSFSPKELHQSIRKYVPEFKINYHSDFRQIIADSWPNSINDKEARQDWGWTAKYKLDEMTKDMLSHLEQKYIVKARLNK